MVNSIMTETAGSLQEQMEMLEEYLLENYEFRHNVLSDKFEIRERKGEQAFRTLSREAFNTLIRRIKKDGPEITSLKQNLEEFIYSEETLSFDPITHYLSHLPQWDGQNHIGKLFGRIPGITTEQQYLLAIWLRSAVAHWLNMDMLHGNETVITLIGRQGCGKSTFCARLLPEHLRCYYLDHLNLANKFDKEMALTSNLLVNLDELEQIKPSQHAELKQALSKNRVNGRPIFGRAQNDRRRFASFVSTTNNPRPLTDPTGSRRFLCIQIPDKQILDNDGEIDYLQLYAQVVHELREEKMRYWYTEEEVKRIQELNADYQQVTDLGTMIETCLRHPEENEVVVPLTTAQISEVINRTYPGVKTGAGFCVKLGIMLKRMEFQRRSMGKGQEYYIVPRKVA
ncbi:MAG: VapE family protein [Bacteroidales bacterium]|nr:VapE family protein [Bacteroidales bacterium]